MAVFTPRNSNEILRELLGKLLNRTELSDISAGSTVFTIMNAVAIELANVETRLNNIRNGYSLQTAVGTELDARCAELPPGNIFRKKSSFAAGSVLSVSREDATEELIISAGSLIQNGITSAIYQIPQQIILAINETQKDDIYIVAISAGSSSNAEIGQITTNVNIEGIDSLINTKSLTTGLDEESDGFLRARALKYVKSLGKSTKDALEYLGESFISNDGQTIKFSKIFEDISQPAYSELILDDGNGLLNQETIANTAGGTIYSDSQRLIYHERPAISPILPNQIGLSDSLGNTKIVTLNDYVSIPERGIIYFNQGFLKQGDTWSITNYNIYKGIIADLQEEIEGTNNTSQLANPGYRAAGTRVRVLPPIVETLTFTVQITPNSGLNLNNTKNTIKNLIVAYINNLPIGEPLIISKLNQVLQNSGLIITCIIQDNDGGSLVDIYPAQLKNVLRTNNNLITVR
jgi:uncharacterized phage protein gp47/JayE